MEQQLDFTQQDFQPEKMANQFQTQEENIIISSPLQQQYQSAKANFSEKLVETIKSFVKYRENRTYHLFVSDKTDYFSSMWHHLQKKLNSNSSTNETDLLELIAIRQSNILYDIMENRLEVSQHQKIKPYDYEQDQRMKKVNILKDQSTQIQRNLVNIHEEIHQIKRNTHQSSQSRIQASEINAAKMKEYQSFVKKQMKEKEERLKFIQQHKKKEEQEKGKKDQEEKEAKQKILKEKKEQLFKKLKDSESRRIHQKSEREERQKQYKVISKSLANQPPLFKKIEQNYHYRYAQDENERRQKIMNERHSLYHYNDSQSLDQHEKKYEKQRSVREIQRKDRVQELEKMMQLQQEEIHSKYKSHYQIKTYIDPKIQQRKLALEKKEKVKRYINQTVKQHYLPRIDEDKRNEILQLIEDLSKKKVKKVVREDGSVEYEEVRPSDPRMVGLEYLQKAKEIGAKMRGKRKKSDQIQSTQDEKPKVFDYLGQRRKKGSSYSNRDNKLSFVEKKGLSFDEKVKQVQVQSEKLSQLAKQKEMKLKYGKFTTSEQILQHKEDIDQHYLDIINMKLKLINYKQE